MASFRVEDVIPIRGGIAAMMTGGEVAAAVREKCAAVASAANSAAISRRSGIPGRVRGAIEHFGADGSFSSAPYGYQVYAGRADTIGRVGPATREGQYDDNQHHTVTGLAH